MKRKYFLSIIVIVILAGGYLLYMRFSDGIPATPPSTVVKYNGKAVATSLGDQNWIPEDGGSSYETGGEYKVGLKTSEFQASPGENIDITVPKSPLKVRVYQILDDNYKHIEYESKKEGEEYTFNLPTEKGEYIFNVFANWDSDKHNTSTIFRVIVK